MNHSTSNDSISPQVLLQALQWRYATKSFDPEKKLTTDQWQVLQESLRLAPSSYGAQPWKFIVVQDSELRKKLRAVSWNQSQVTDCSHYVVIVAHEKMNEAHIDAYLADIVETRGVTLDSLKGFKAAMMGDLVKGPRSETILHWAQRQCYIAMGFLMESAALLKVDACPIEGLDPVAYNDILGLKGTEWGVVATVALGFRKSTDQFVDAKKVRFSAERVIEFR
jgi:nitroreductase